MKQRRYTWWRILLTLLLGGSAWWFVNWWLTPRPWYTCDIDVASWPKPEGRISGSSIELNRVSGADLIDKAGRYLLLKTVSSEFNYRLVDLQSRQVVAEHTINGWPLVDELRFWRMQQQLQVDNVLLVTSQAVTESDNRSHEGQPQFFRYTLWEWNIPAGTSRRIRDYSQGIHVSLSNDGTTLLEVERRPILSPTQLLPPSLASVLTGQAVASLHLEDLAMYRVYSLPGMELRCTLIKPWMYRQGHAVLSSSGEYLVFDDIVLPRGFTSPLAIDSGGRESSITVTPTCVTVPHGVSIYRTRDGSLLAENSEPDMYVNYISNNDDQTLLFLTMQANAQPDRRTRVFHVPSQRWLDKPVYVAYPLAQGLLHAKGVFDINQSKVFTINQVGDQQAVGTVVGVQTQLLPGSPHYLKETADHPLSALPLPASWEEWLRQFPMFAKWFVKYSSIEIVDYTSQRVILKLRGIDTAHLHYRVSDRWLVCWSDNLQAMRVEVYALPIRAWSVWWARSAGLIVLLLAWWVLCRPKGSNVQVFARRTVTK